MLVVLDTSTEREWLLEADARQVVNHVQKLRKRAKLQPSDPITIFFQVSGEISSAQQSQAGDKKQSGAKEDKTANKTPAAATSGELEETLTRFGGFIHQTLLQPLFRASKPLPKDFSNVLIRDSFQVSFNTQNRTTTSYAIS